MASRAVRRLTPASSARTASGGSGSWAANTPRRIRSRRLSTKSSIRDVLFMRPIPLPGRGVGLDLVYRRHTLNSGSPDHVPQLGPAILHRIYPGPSVERALTGSRRSRSAPRSQLIGAVLSEFPDSAGPAATLFWGCPRFCVSRSFDGGGGVIIDNHSDVAVQPTLRSRGPAYSVMQECLRIQATAPP